MKQSMRWFSAAALALLLAIPLSIPRPAVAGEPFMTRDDPAASRAAGYGHAFGRIILYEDGKETSFGLFSELMIVILSVKTGETERLRFLGDNEFYWSLKPGEYAIVE
jgi:hypothetical protein